MRIWNPFHQPSVASPLPNHRPEKALPKTFTRIEDLPLLLPWRVKPGGEGSPSVSWRAEAFPLRVSGPPELKAFIWKALQEWQRAGGEALQFVPAPDPETADICIQWRDAPVLGRDYEVGHTRRHVQDNPLGAPWIRQAEITLIRQPAIDGHLSETERQQRLYTTLLHEIGHALGLEHSPDPQDVMHHRGWKNPTLSPGDVAQIQALYAPGVEWRA